jgi:hypothetical protein
MWKISYKRKLIAYENYCLDTCCVSRQTRTMSKNIFLGGLILAPSGAISPPAPRVLRWTYLRAQLGTPLSCGERALGELSAASFGRCPRLWHEPQKH